MSAGRSALRVVVLGPVNSPHLEDQALAVARRGHDVVVTGAPWPDLPPTSLPTAGIPVRIMARPWPLGLHRLLRDLRPDVVHAHFLPYAGGAALVGARPLVATAWGSDVYRAGWKEALGNRLAVRRADAIAADSSPLLERMIELGAPRDRMILLNWGVDLDAFTPVDEAARAALKRELGLGPGPVVLSSRGLSDVYNPQTVLDAFALVARDVPDAQLVVKHAAAGDVDLVELPLTDRTRLVGRVPYERMADYYRVADVCISIPWSDSSPRSVWEAMACGSVCVLSDLPWVHDLIEPGRHALVAPIEPAAVASAIRRLLDNPDARTAIAAAARDLVERHRNERHELDRLEALYRRLADTRR